MDEIIEGGSKVKWSDIAGQEVNFIQENTRKLERSKNIIFMCGFFPLRLQSKLFRKW